MKLTIQRDQTPETFTLQATKAVTLLSAFYEIKSKLDPTLTFGAGCRSGVCGSCAVLVNGKEQLACGYTYQDGDLIEPLHYHPILRDLKVDKTQAHDTIKKVIIQPHTSTETPTPTDESKTKIQTDCILCDSCYSSCPVLAVNPDFLGPFALTRAWRYVAGSPQGNQGHPQGGAPTIAAVQRNGIWDCTLCGECTVACPQGIDPKTDIMMLRGASGKAGYSDPNFAVQDFGTPDFGGGF